MLESRINRLNIMCVIEVDIVEADVPLLISRTSSPRMHAVIDFRIPRLTLLSNVIIPLSISKGGHIVFPAVPLKPGLLKN